MLKLDISNYFHLKIFSYILFCIFNTNIFFYHLPNVSLVFSANSANCMQYSLLQFFFLPTVFISPALVLPLQTLHLILLNHFLIIAASNTFFLFVWTSANQLNLFLYSCFGMLPLFIWTLPGGQTIYLCISHHSLLFLGKRSIFLPVLS